MINSNITKFLMAGVALSILTGCGLASLPGGYSPIEQQTVQDLNTSNYTPRSADERAAILTQDLFAQAAFWSREYDLNPADLEAAINLASTLRRLGNPKKSIEVAQTTRALYPRDVELMAELAAAQLADNNPKKALSIIDSALAQRPNMARLWSLKGAALDQFEQYAEARQQYARGLAIAPNDPGIIANVGLSYALEGDPKTAEIWLRRAANMPGASEAVRQNLSLVLGLQNKFEEAEKWASRDLDAQAASQNMSYIRTLRGAATPMTNVQKPIGSPKHSAPQSAPKTYAPNPSKPRIYGAPKPNTPNTYQPPAHMAPARPAQQGNYARQPLPKARLNMVSDLSQYSGGPKTSREAALAMARQSSAKNVRPAQAGRPQMQMQRSTTPQSQPPQSQIKQSMTPQDVLGRISQNNTPKTTIAQNQRQQMAYRAQMQARQRAAQQMPPQAYPQNQTIQPQMPYGAPNPYPQAGYPQVGVQQQPVQSQAIYDPRYGQIPPAQQERRPARPRRR